MKNLLKLQVLFTTLIDSSKSQVLCKISNVDLIEDLIKKGLQNLKSWNMQLPILILFRRSINMMYHMSNGSEYMT